MSHAPVLTLVRGAALPSLFKAHTGNSATPMPNRPFPALLGTEMGAKPMPELCKSSPLCSLGTRYQWTLNRGTILSVTEGTEGEKFGTVKRHATFNSTRDFQRQEQRALLC